MPFRFIGGPGPSITYARVPIERGAVVTDDWLAGDERFISVSDPGDAVSHTGWCDQHHVAVEIGKRMKDMPAAELYGALSTAAHPVEKVPIPAPGVIEAINAEGSASATLIEQTVKARIVATSVPKTPRKKAK